MSFCYACGYEFAEDFKVYRTTECPSCGRDVKVCLNCHFYSPGSDKDCREHISETVTDKDKSNFCDFFRLGGSSSDGNIRKKSKDARSAFENLFNDE